MAEKKSGWDSWNKKKAKQALRKIHAGYIIIMAVCLTVGAIAGSLYAGKVIAKDTFILNGEREHSVTVGDELSYTDEGILCISEGKDLSDKIEIRTNMTRSEDGKTYTGDTSAEKEYYIEYTVTEGRYEGLSRTRIFTVSPVSADIK